MLNKNKIFKHILFPYKGTPAEKQSFNKTVLLASSLGAEITIFTCLEERHAFGFFKTKASKREFEREHTLARKQHDILQRFAKDYGVSCVSKIVKNGMPSIKILEFAKKHNTDLIVMTRTKLSSHYERLHHHSTVENVLANASCPIMILN